MRSRRRLPTQKEGRCAHIFAIEFQQTLQNARGWREAAKKPGYRAPGEELPDHSILEPPLEARQRESEERRRNPDRLCRGGENGCSYCPRCMRSRCHISPSVSRKSQTLCRENHRSQTSVPPPSDQTWIWRCSRWHCHRDQNRISDARRDK